jgi:hypothetical protein
MPVPVSSTSESLSINVTVSIGVAVYPEHGSSQEVLEAADDALYAAKAAGRDTARLAGTPAGPRGRRRSARRGDTEPLLRVISDDPDPDSAPDRVPGPATERPAAPPPPVSGGESHRPHRPPRPGGG